MSHKVHRDGTTKPMSNHTQVGANFECTKARFLFPTFKPFLDMPAAKRRHQQGIQRGRRRRVADEILGLLGRWIAGDDQPITSVGRHRQPRLGTLYQMDLCRFHLPLNRPASGRLDRSLLAKMALPLDEVERRVTSVVAEADGALRSILPEVERLLGPARPVAEVLEGIDKQYRLEGGPAVHFLNLNQPIVPHLEQLLGLTHDGLTSQGHKAFMHRDYALAVVLIDAAVDLNRDQKASARSSWYDLKYRAHALGNLGALEQARDQLSQVIVDMEKESGVPPTVMGGYYWDLSRYEYLLGVFDAAELSATRSLSAYERAPKDSQRISYLIEHVRSHLAKVKSGKKPPQRKDVDFEVKSVFAGPLYLPIWVLFPCEGSGNRHCHPSRLSSSSRPPMCRERAYRPRGRQLRIRLGSSVGRHTRLVVRFCLQTALDW